MNKESIFETIGRITCEVLPELEGKLYRSLGNRDDDP